MRAADALKSMESLLVKINGRIVYVKEGISYE
jgi:hypothetical protein